MAYMIPEDELGDLRCSDLDVPIFHPGQFHKVTTPYLLQVTEETWGMIVSGKCNLDSVDLLFDMCNEMLDWTIASVLDIVAPQIHDRLTDQEGADNSSPIDNTLMTNDTETEENKYNYFRVTQEDIQASIGDSFHTCFGGVHQKKTKYSEKLQEEFAAEVAWRVNQAINLVSPTSPPCTSRQSRISTDSTRPHLEDMVYSIMGIMRELVAKKKEPPESPDQETDVKAQESDVKAQESKIKAQESDVKAQESRIKAQESDVKAQESKIKAQESDVKAQESDVKAQESRIKAQESDVKAQESKIKAQESDVKAQESDVKAQEKGNKDIRDQEMDIEEISLENPKVCNQDQDTDMKDQELETEHNDEAFEEAEAKTLTENLQKPKGKFVRFGAKVAKIFCQKSRKISPSCKINTPASQEKQKSRVNSRMLSSMGMVLKMYVTCCMSCVVDD